MSWALLRRSMRDSWPLLVSASVLTFAFVWVRMWVAAKIKVDAFVKMFSEGLKIFTDLLPVSIEDLASPLGRAAFTYEELPVILLLGLWTVTRGSDCLAGRLGSGTMEMLLAQPLRRITLVATHSAVTLGGVALLGVVSWLGLGVGLATSDFDPRPALSTLVPSAVNYLGLGVFLLGLATLASALARTRSQAVAVVIGFYVVQLALMIVARLSPRAEWLEWLTILSAYEPTLLAIGLDREPEEYGTLFWQYNAWLFGLGAGMWSAAAMLFCHRDVPAPL